MWLHTHTVGTGAAGDKAPGWYLRTEAALQVALLAGWPPAVLQERWPGLVQDGRHALSSDPTSPRAWGNRLASAHGRMDLAARAAALDDTARWTAIGTLWRAHGWERRDLGKAAHTVRRTPVLQDLFTMG